MKTYKIFKYLIAITLFAFAFLTLFLSSSVLFDWFGMRAKEGNYVSLVVWSNFVASLLYLLAAYGYTFSKKWPFRVMLIAFVVLLLGFIALAFHIYSGALYETRTIGAMTFRVVVTLFFVWVMYREVRKKL